jgi:methanol--5-hydroxybenzimidazolylcobamide Co-methyltransferase
MQLAISSLDDFVFGRAPKPVACGRGLCLGQGTVIPEINFTWPSLSRETADFAGGENIPWPT